MQAHLHRICIRRHTLCGPFRFRSTDLYLQAEPGLQRSVQTSKHTVERIIFLRSNHRDRLSKAHHFTFDLLRVKNLFSLALTANSEFPLLQEVAHERDSLVAFWVDPLSTSGSRKPASAYDKLFPAILCHDNRLALAWFEANGRSCRNIQSQVLLERKDTVESQGTIRFQERIM